MPTIDQAPHLRSLGTFIRERRRSLGLTQTELAERLGYVQERISLLEHGKYGMPSLPALDVLAQKLEVPLADVLRAAGFPAEPPVAAHAVTGSDSTVTETRQRLQGLKRENARLAHEVDHLQQRMSSTWEQMERANQLRDHIVESRGHIREVVLKLCQGETTGEGSIPLPAGPVN
jgi:transcriptional regulator with XRE-family HTH domain